MSVVESLNAAAESLRSALDAHTRQEETLAELAQVLDDMRHSLGYVDLLVPHERLVLGSFVKVCGEWYTLVGRDGFGRLELSDDRGTRTFYTPDEGERFLTESPF